jgi:hypothetical protein
MTRCSLPERRSTRSSASRSSSTCPTTTRSWRRSRASSSRRAGGYFTTPNGDYVKNEPPNYNPDHLRHYRREQLEQLLARHFARVRVVYGVRTGVHRRAGLRSLSRAARSVRR